MLLLPEDVTITQFIISQNSDSTCIATSL